MCVSVVVVVLVMCAGVVVFNCQGRRFVVPSLCSFSSGHLLAERREGVEGTEKGGATAALDDDETGIPSRYLA